MLTIGIPPNRRVMSRLVTKILASMLLIPPNYGTLRNDFNNHGNLRARQAASSSLMALVIRTQNSEAIGMSKCSTDSRRGSRPNMQILGDRGAGAESWHSRSAWAAVPRLSLGVVKVQAFLI